MELSIGLPANPTSSQTGTFYFAYGSNLSPEQMAGRCPEYPATSSIPVAIARLDGWRWIICGRGYANVVPSPRRSPQSGVAPKLKSRSESDQDGEHDQHPHPATAPASDVEQKADSPGTFHEDDDSSVVWGLIYNLTAGSESILDGYEGHHTYRNPTPTPNPSPDAEEVRRKPFLQGTWDYNKLYLPVRVTKWLQDPVTYGVVGSKSYAPEARSKSENADQAAEMETGITALVYVDELRTSPGPVKPEYVGRMNRAIRQSVELGIPRGWVERVMRRWIVEGVEVGERGYLGRSDGHWKGDEYRTDGETINQD
ncbi:hypothetical protein EPUS_02336 [Endocarpon pusillum Z07020]|uniref:gamma-glutamylcyclotransferase n=1 Tax=Endocarpon pusillum (strain Z07020 / HMAS-L-300199) TaxID=1263415 RepID=U1HP38_ENDPU|nr:uncharacterized protein EPUS_02336 [Endocarpon pusillum Z07020]ERF70814.1 hypothetical protein EPUS_02336 [Endocarpon pusillum Z07020]